MEHKLDDFLRKKIESLEDTLPDNSTFDEQLFWGELQKNLDKPQRKGWWKWVAIAACIGGLSLWIVSVSTITAETSRTSHIEKVNQEMEVECARKEPVVTVQKVRVKPSKMKKKEAVQPKKELKIEIEQLAVKVNTIHVQASIIKQDSIHFNPATMAEVKPQFRTIHANEISNTEKAPIPQPKFKIRFAARNQH